MKKTIFLIGVVAGLATNLLVADESPPVYDAYEEGTHYMALQIPLKTRSPGKIEVTEYFSYACPHCYQFEPMIAAWHDQLADDVVFNRTPAIWSQAYQLYAQTYYTADALGVLAKAHGRIFEAIHSQQRRLDDKEEMALFFSEFGVDPIDFAKMYNSFGVRASMQQAEARGRGYRSQGVPAIIVNGKYRVESKMAGGNAKILLVTAYLVELERQAMSQAAIQE